jgi:hypothetical protein
VPIFGWFAVHPGRAAGADAHVPQRINDEEYRHCQLEDHGSQREEGADYGGAGLEQRC